MKTAALVKDGTVLIHKVELAVRLHQRMKGLLGRRPHGLHEAVWLFPCSGVHTWFMQFNLDIFFLDREMRVVNVARNVVPWRTVWAGRPAQSVLETTAGYLSANQIEKGDVVSLVGL